MKSTTTITTLCLWLIAIATAAATASAAAATTNSPPASITAPSDAVIQTLGLAFASAVAVGSCVFGAAFAMGRIGTAALGAAAEKPELLMRTLLFMALAEGLGVLGFAIAILLLQKIN
jgi:V/A-type H+-transporting ATPase subunit K